MTDREEERPGISDDDPEPSYDPHPLEGGQTEAVDDAQEAELPD